MTTRLSTPVSRETIQEYRPDGGGAARPLIVTLHPGGVITLRPKGTKREVSVTIAWVYERAVMGQAGIPARRGK